VKNKAASLGLGLFSLGLGIGEILISRRIARLLEAEGRERAIRGAGIQGVRAGIGLLRAPTVGARAWDGAGSGLRHLSTLGVLAVRTPRNRAVWGAIALVGAATVGELILAKALEQASAGPDDAPPGETPAGAEGGAPAG